MKRNAFKNGENFKEFYESVGAFYPEEDLVYNSLRGQIRRKFIIRHLSNLAGKLLDLGCNRGGYILEYKNGPALGIDISLPVLKIAKKRTKANIVQGDGQNLAFLVSGCIDSVLCSEVIEHVPGAGKLLSECFRVLRLGGQLLLTTPNYKNTKPIWVKIDEMAEYGVEGVRENYYYHTAFRPEELYKMAENAGFKFIETGTFEKEVKYATRIPVVLFYSISFLNKVLFKNKWIDKQNKKILDKLSLIIYKTCCFLGLNKILIKFVKEGVRSYLIAKK